MATKKRGTPPKSAVRVKRLEQLVEAAGALIVGLDRRGRITLFNRRCEELTGYSRNEVMGKVIFPLLILDIEREAVRNRFKRLLERKLPSEPSLAHWVTKTGEHRLMRWNNTFIKDDTGEVREIFGIGIDITDQKQVEIALRDSEHKYRTIFDNAGDIIMIYDLEGHFLEVNQVACKSLGYSREELLQMNPQDLETEEYAEQFEDRINIIQKQGFAIFETTYERKDGQIIPTEISNRIIEFEGNPAILTIARDFTKRKQAELRMIRARNLAEFLVDLMAHDLNNINQGIMSALEIIKHDPSFPEELEVRIQAALNQVERSAELIDSVKRFQRIDIEPRTLKKTPVYPELIQAFQAIERTFPHKEVILTTNLRKGEHQVLADQFLSELFYNLLHNAVKFDRSERVSVDINAAITQDKRFLRIQIMDHGPGISDDEKERIFSRLAHPQRGVKGSGMGLTLVSRILERYGGEIAVTDRVPGEHSQGANFILLLPRSV